MTNASILSIFGTCDSHTDFKVKSQSHGAGAYCGGHLAAQLVFMQKEEKPREGTLLQDPSTDFYS